MTERTVTIWTATGRKDVKAGDMVTRWVSVGSNGQGVEEADLQELRIIRINRVTVTVRTKWGSQFRTPPQNLAGIVDWETDW